MATLATLADPGLDVEDAISAPDKCFLEALRHLRQLPTPEANVRKPGPHSSGPARPSTRGSITNDDFFQEDDHTPRISNSNSNNSNHPVVCCRRCQRAARITTARPRRTCKRNAPLLNTYATYLSGHRTAFIDILSVSHAPRKPVEIPFPQ